VSALRFLERTETYEDGSSFTYAWYDHRLVRRFVLARFVRRKHWHPRARHLARVRWLYWVLIRGWDSEICGRCGGPVRVVFHVPDWIWERAAGFRGSNARSPGGESAGGVLCISCVDDLADDVGLPYLRWTCDTRDWPMEYGMVRPSNPNPEEGGEL
jgi:hypothetical protein